MDMHSTPTVRRLSSRDTSNASLNPGMRYKLLRIQIKVGPCDLAAVRMPLTATLSRRLAVCLLCRFSGRMSFPARVSSGRGNATFPAAIDCRKSWFLFSWASFFPFATPDTPFATVDLLVSTFLLLLAFAFQ